MSDITALKLEFSSITSTTCCDTGTWAKAIAAQSTMAADTLLPSVFQFIKKSPQIVGRALAPFVHDTNAQGSFRKRTIVLRWQECTLNDLRWKRKNCAPPKYLVHECRGSYGEETQ